MIDLKHLTIKKAHDALIRGEYTAVDLTKTYLEEIKKHNHILNIYLEVFDDALLQAQEADDRIKRGEKDNLLLGIPFSVKDNILISGKKVSAASKVLEGYIAPFDATVIKKLKEKGVVFLGRTNMDEFAMGASTENSAFGVTKNPKDSSRVAGGSSGGGAASIAAQMALVALGSDTGGSIRQPAAFCGVVGLKPTFGAVSRHGLIAMGSSFDQIGPITNSVEDAQIVFDAIAGNDEFDATTRSLVNTERKLKKKIGVCRSLLSTKGLHEEIRENFEDMILKLEKTGFEIVDVELPNIHYSIPAYYIIVPAEVSSNMARFDGVKFGAKISGQNLIEDYMKTRGELIGHEVRRRILIGTYVLSSGYYDAYYNKANNARTLIKKDFILALNDLDAIAMPTIASPAFKIGEKGNDPVQMYLEDVFTSPANLAGLPSIAVPSGCTKENLPLSIQFVGREGEEQTLFDLGNLFEVLK